MKVNWKAWSSYSLYLVIAAAGLSVLWALFKWPGLGFAKFLPLPFAALSFLVSHFVKRDRLKKEALKGEIRALSNDLTLRGDFTINDFDLLYEADELGRIVSLLMKMPEGRRKLQSAVDVIDNESV